MSCNVVRATIFVERSEVDEEIEVEIEGILERGESAYFDSAAVEGHPGSAADINAIRATVNGQPFLLTPSEEDEARTYLLEQNDE